MFILDRVEREQLKQKEELDVYGDNEVVQNQVRVKSSEHGHALNVPLGEGVLDERAQIGIILGLLDLARLALEHELDLLRLLSRRRR